MSTNKIHANFMRCKREQTSSQSYKRVLTQGKHILGYHGLYQPPLVTGSEGDGS